jgi:hypothetical protein
MIDHSIRDGRSNAHGNALTISRRLLFVEIRSDGKATMAGYAPYLDYLPLPENYKERADVMMRDPWLNGDLEKQAVGYAISNVVPEHLREVKTRREKLIEKTETEVHARLKKEINFWDQRAVDLEAQESTGKRRSKLNSSNARARAEALAERLKKRMDELQKERQITAPPPTILGGALILPQGCFADEAGSNEVNEPPAMFAGDNRDRTERLAMEAVMRKERELGNEPEDVCLENRGYDIQSRDPETGALRFLEVKGRAAGAVTVTVTKNEILTSLNRPEGYYLVLVEVDDDAAREPRYIANPFSVEPDFGTASVNFKIRELLKRVQPQ